jgi:hypothetical protein
MRRGAEWIVGSTLMAMAITAPGFSQGSSSVHPNAVPVTIQVVLTKGEGDKKVSSPYSLTSSSGGTTSLRIGAEVPMGRTGAGGQSSFTFQQIGTQIDSRIVPVEDGTAEGRYKVQITITKRDFYDTNSATPIPQGDPSRPVFYNFIFAGTIILRNGETAQITGTDMVSNETWRADVTLSLKR